MNKIYIYHYKDNDYNGEYFITTNTYAKPLLDDIEKYFDFDLETFIENVGDNNKILREYLEKCEFDLDSTYIVAMEILQELGWWVDHSVEKIYY
jgi:hypothetical protein